MVEEIKTCFFGVYLLYCTNPQFVGRNYIGFTVNPERRLKQHNRGKNFGGAWKTSNRGPWKMVLIVHGFPNDIAALRFEWAWQHPQLSRRLNHVTKKKKNEKMFDYNLRILSEMLNVGPWCRLPLIIRWLESEYEKDFSINKIPPIHMSICFGPVMIEKKHLGSQKKVETNNEHNVYEDKCYCCNQVIEPNEKITCLSDKCKMNIHLICLGKLFLEIGEYVPIEGNCPKCNLHFLWGDLLKKTEYYKHFLEKSIEDKESCDSDSD